MLICKASERVNGASLSDRAFLLLRMRPRFDGWPLGHQTYLCRRARKGISRYRLVDKAGVKIGTNSDAPAERVLMRQIKTAEIIRIPLSPSRVTWPNCCAPAGRRLWGGSGVDILLPTPCWAQRSYPARWRCFAWRPRFRRAAPKRRRLYSRHSSMKQNGSPQKAIDPKGLKGVNVATKPPERRFSPVARRGRAATLRRSPK